MTRQQLKRLRAGKPRPLLVLTLGIVFIVALYCIPVLLFILKMQAHHSLLMPPAINPDAGEHK